MSRDGDRFAREPFEPGALLLGRYEFVRVLGAGAMGQVLDVRDRRSGQRYALKRIPPELVRNPAQMEAVRANFNLVQGLTHPHIAVTRFLEADDATGHVYILMDLVRGRDLQTWLEQRRHAQPDPAAPLPLPIALGIAEQAAAALDYAHAKPIYAPDGSVSRHGVLHRDLKPANMMTVDGQEYRPGVPYVLLVDFGLAAEIQASMLSSTVHVEGGNMLAGSPLYMSPEQWVGRTLTRAVDQWALAVMLYEMVEGGPPFPGPTRDELRAQAMFQQPVPPEVFSPAQWEALKTAFEKDRTKRHPNCTALVQAVATADAEGGAEAFPPAGPGAAAGSKAGSKIGSKPSVFPPSSGSGKKDKEKPPAGTTGRWPPTNATTLPAPGSTPQTAPLEDEEPFPLRPRRAPRRNAGVFLAVGVVAALAGAALFWPIDRPAPPPEVDPAFASRVLVRGDGAGSVPEATSASSAATAGEALVAPTGPLVSPAATHLLRSPWLPPLGGESAGAASPSATGSATAAPAPTAAPPAPPPFPPPSLVPPVSPSPFSEKPKTAEEVARNLFMSGDAPAITPTPTRDVESKGVVRFKIEAKPVGFALASALRFRLVEDAPQFTAQTPTGATLDASTGEFVWTAPDVFALTLFRATFEASGGVGEPSARGHAFIRVWPQGRLNWPSVGGPWGSGISDAPDLPTRWGPNQNIVWTTKPPPGVEWSSPVVWEDKIWMSTRTPEKWGALCLSKSTGAVLRTIDLPLGVPIAGAMIVNAPTPVVEADRVYFYCGKNGAVCLNSADGGVAWTNREVVEGDEGVVLAAPLLHRDRLLLPITAAEGPRVFALDTATGKEVWRATLPWASDDRKWQFDRPLLCSFGGSPQLILCAGGAVGAFDPSSGALLWRSDHPKIVRPLALYFAGAKIGVCGFDETPDGAPGAAEDLYAATFAAPEDSRSSPLLRPPTFGPPGPLAPPRFDPPQTLGKFTALTYAAAFDGVLCLGGQEAVGVDAATGTTLWGWPLEGNNVTCTFIGGKKAYFFRFDGRCGVLDLKTGEILSVNPEPEKSGSYPKMFASERSLFVYGRDVLYRIEEPAKP